MQTRQRATGNGQQICRPVGRCRVHDNPGRNFCGMSAWPQQEFHEHSTAQQRAPFASTEEASLTYLTDI